MKRLAAVLVALVGLAPGFAAAAGAISFGITAPYTKVGGGAAPLWNPSQAHVAVSGNDVYVAYGEVTAAGDNEVLVGHSSDGGLTWDAGTVVAHGPGLVPTGAVAVSGDPSAPGSVIVHVVYGAMTDAYGNGSIYYTHLRGGAWSSPVLVSGSSTATADSGAVAANANGHVSIVYAASSATRRSESGDGGDGFYVLDGIVGPAGSRPSVTLDTAGDEFVAWADNAGIWFARRNSLAFDFGAPVYAGNTYKGGSPVLVSLDANHLYIAYDFGMALGSFGIALSASTDGGATFTSRNLTTTQTGHVGLAISSSGALSLAYDANGIVLQRSTNGGSSWTSPVAVDAALGSEFPSLALVAGKVVVAYDKNPGQAVYLTKEK